MASKNLPVLIIDDDLNISEALGDHLRFRGYQVCTVNSGTEALAYLNHLTPKDRPSIILLDVLMPGVNGCQVLQEVRALPATRDIPVMMLSVLSKDEVQDQISCPCAGYNAYVSKPFEMDQVIKQMEGLLHAA